MRTAMITLMATAAIVGFAGAASATGGPDDEMALTQSAQIINTPETYIAAAPVAAQIEDLNVTAQRLPNNTPVAVTGTVSQARNGMLILERPDGVVHVKAGGQVLDRFGRTQQVTQRVYIGDSVTAYGRIRHGMQAVGVEAEALYIPTSARTADLVILKQERLESLSKLNLTPNGKATLRSLQITHNEL